MAYFTYTHCDKVLIKHYRQDLGYGTRTHMGQIPDKKWTEGSIKKIFKKIDEEDTIERKAGSGRPRSARTRKLNSVP